MAPEGEWACPAHSERRGRKKTETELLELDAQRGERGMRHKPPRIDQKYQILPAPMMSPAEQEAYKRTGAGEKAGDIGWVRDKCNDAEVVELLAFCHRLVGPDNSMAPPLERFPSAAKCGSEPRFIEGALTHLHLSGYSLPLAKANLLRAQAALAALPEVDAERLRVLGHAEGELLMAAVGHAHSHHALMRPSIQCVAVGVSEVLSQMPTFKLTLSTDTAAAAAEAQAHEAAHAAACQAAIASWETSLDAALADISCDLDRIKQLVADGALAHKANVRYLNPAAAATRRLCELIENQRIATSWKERCDSVLAKPASPEALADLLAEGEAIPLKLAEVAEVRNRIERIHAWTKGAQAAMGTRCELRELQELQREAEALRLKTPEADALAARTNAAKKWTTRVHNELLRRKSSRKAESAKLTIADVEALIVEAGTLQLEAAEIEQARDRLADAEQWRAEAQAVLTPPVPVTPETHEVLQELSGRAEALNLALDEQDALDARLALVKDWQARAKAAMADASSTWQLLTALVKEAKANGIKLPEVPLLAEQQAEQAWVGQAELALDGPAQLEDLQELDESSKRLADTPRAAEMAKRLKIKLEVARKWELRLKEEGPPATRPALKEASALLSEADADKVTFPALDALRSAVSKAKVWVESVRAHAVAQHARRRDAGDAARAARAVGGGAGAAAQPARGGHARDAHPRG